jgi:PAT family acetyl-CoA transporter-like MFS transporter 1
MIKGDSISSSPRRRKNKIDEKELDGMQQKDDKELLSEPVVVKHSIKTQDKISIAVLILLYTLQGIPMGLSGSIPLILKEKGASYDALSLFSLVSMPFSLKLIWAPFVDCFYSTSFGRRKTWLVPVQFITGLVMLFGASYVAEWLGDSSQTNLAPDGDSVTSSPQIGHLTAFFVFLYFLMATQDIAVDGWALTMLSRESVGYASICNTIGQVLGIFIANQGFIALSDARWCHNYLGINGGGLVTLPAFMQFWGYVFIVVTLLIWLFKKEEPVDSSDHPDGLLETCQQVVAILRLPAIQSIAVILLTCRLALAPSDAVFPFKLQVSVACLIPPFIPLINND